MAEQQASELGGELLGFYHSHPDHPYRYSDFDRDHALQNMSYVIVSVQRGRVTTTQAWRLLEDRSAMDEEPVALLPQPLLPARCRRLQHSLQFALSLFFYV